jgi:C4-dicarboxylate transporter, DctM subunit
MITTFVGSLVILLLIGLPVAFSLGITSMVGFWLMMGSQSLAQAPIIAYKSLDDFVLSSIPLYILLSQILLAGKVGNDLYDVASKWVRHLPAGLGVATILACAAFAAISGSSVATAVTIGMVAIPEMISRGYPKELVLGLVAGGGTLGILIPPSIPMILFGAITGESVGALFIAGVLPGILLTALFILYVVLFAAKKVPAQPPASWDERFAVLRHSSWGLFLPVLIIGGIYTGLFTPTEAAAVGTVYSLFITFFVYKTLSLRDMPGIMLDTTKTSAMVLAIIIGAMLYGFVLTVMQIPQQLTALVTAMEVNRWVVFIAINILLLFLGCILETVSIILITVPILYPLILKLGFDPIWFAVIMVINMELALITPPVGMNLFVIQGISPGTRMSEILKGVLPFGLLMILTIAVVAWIPELATWLPKFLQ